MVTVNIKTKHTNGREYYVMWAKSDSCNYLYPVEDGIALAKAAYARDHLSNETEFLWNIMF